MPQKKKSKKTVRQSVHPPDTLTPRQELFIEHYIANGGNISGAALKAGYKSRNDGFRIIAIPSIHRRVKEARKKLIDSLSLKSEDLLKEAAHIANMPETSGWNIHAKLAAIELIHKHTGQGAYADGDGAGRESNRTAFKNALERLRNKIK